MSQTLTIPALETGQIRVFAVNRPVPDIAQALKTTSKADIARDLLGAPDLAPDGIELFPVDDLTGVGLTAYLIDGYTVEDPRITKDQARLNALEGYVLILFSAAAKSVEMTLSPGPDLTFIGTYAEFQPLLTAPHMTAESAQPYTGVPRTTPPTPVRGAPGSAMVVAGLVVALGLLVWWLLR